MYHRHWAGTIGTGPGGVWLHSLYLTNGQCGSEEIGEVGPRSSSQQKADMFPVPMVVPRWLVFHSWLMQMVIDKLHGMLIGRVRWRESGSWCIGVPRRGVSRRLQACRMG